MANQIQATGRITFNLDGSQDQVVGDANYTLNRTSSIDEGETRILPLGSWKPLLTGSLGDTRVMYFRNNTTSSNPPSVVQVARDSGGTQLITQGIRAGEGGFMPDSGSSQLWARSF